MTRDELREKVAQEIECFYPNVDRTMIVSDLILDTLFAALKEPTEEMGCAFKNTVSFSPTARWQAMLSASPLAPKGE